MNILKNSITKFNKFFSFLFLIILLIGSNSLICMKDINESNDQEKCSNNTCEFSEVFKACAKSLKKFELAFKDKLLFKKSKGEQEKLCVYEQFIKGAIEALSSGDLDKFDAPASDNACQVRASKTLDIFKNKKDLVLKNLEDALTSGKDENFVLSSDAKYLVLCYCVKYFMDKHLKEPEKLSNFKQQLIFCAVNYLQEVAEKLVEDQNLYYKKDFLLELQKGLNQVGGNNAQAKISAPNFFGVLTLLQDDLKKGTCICLIPKVFCKCKGFKEAYKRKLFYKPNQKKDAFELISEDNIQKSEPLMVVTGNIYEGSFKEFQGFLGEDKIWDALDKAEKFPSKLIKNFKSKSVVGCQCKCIEVLKKLEEKDLLEDIFYPNEAQHTLFPSKVKVKDKGKFEEKAIEIDFSNLPKLKAAFDFYANKSKENGTSMENMGLFLIDHIWADTDGSLMSKLIEGNLE